MRVIFLCEWVPVPRGAGFLISSGNNSCCVGSFPANKPSPVTGKFLTQKPRGLPGELQKEPFGIQLKHQTAFVVPVGIEFAVRP